MPVGRKHRLYMKNNYSRKRLGHGSTGRHLLRNYDPLLKRKITKAKVRLGLVRGSDLVK
jgi:hypothetical protein